MKEIVENQKITPVYIIDGSSFLYRAFFSIRPLTTKEGVSVNAVYGFCRMIRKLIDVHNPSHMLIVWDSKGKTVRHEIFSSYKATRQTMPLDLVQQKELIQEFADTIGIKQIAIKTIEADDIMYSIAKQLEKKGQSAVVVTSDKDLGQVLSAQVTIFDPFKDTMVTKETLETQLGFELSKLPFYYALIGDSSDNIPGVAGIGPKGGTKIVQEFESLVDLYANLEKIDSERIRQLLIESKENAFLSEKLFTLQMYETGLEAESLSFNQESWEQAYPLFEKYGFKSLLKEVGLPETEVTLHQKYEFICVKTEQQLISLGNLIKEKGVCAIDTEGTSLNPLQGEMVGISVCVEDGTAYYIPFGHRTGEPQISREKVVEHLKPIFEDTKIEKYLHHAKFDALMLSTAGIQLQGVTFDTILAASLALEGSQRIGLKALSESHLGESMTPFMEVLKKFDCANFAYVPLDPATRYAAADAHQTMRLVPVFRKLLQEKGLTKLFFDIEINVMKILTLMEQSGIRLDTTVLSDINKVVSRNIDELKGQIAEFIGSEFAGLNLNSPKQLGVLLFEHLKLPVIKKTASKSGYSTDSEVLLELEKVHPVPGLINRYRELYKLKSTYLDALGEYVHPATRAVHTTYNQTAVATGRLASADPNLQNIPVDHFELRSAFKPREGMIFLSADYSQIELRVLAHVSQDPTLLTAFKEGKDIHSLTAAGLFSVAPEQITSEQRKIGKRINFSILYGLTAHGLSKDLGISHNVAKSYIDAFMAQYPGVVKWMDSVIEQTKEKGYVETFFGRRRYLPGIYERNRTLYDLAKRVAINTVAQGTASELMKVGMVNLEKAYKEASLDAQMLLQIHDEILIEVPQQSLEKAELLTRKILESVVSWSIPLIVTTRSGADWQKVTK